MAEAMGQLAKIGQELMRVEEERDPLWRKIPVAKEITVIKGIAERAPWEKIQVFNQTDKNIIESKRKAASFRAERRSWSPWDIRSTLGSRCSTRAPSFPTTLLITSAI